MAKAPPPIGNEELPALAGEAPAVAGEAALVPQSIVTQQVVKLARDMRGPTNFTGVVAFLIFALQRRLRVFIWYGGRREDLLGIYAPWASTVISTAAPLKQSPAG